MDRYGVTLTGLTPLIMHADNLAFSEKVKAWQKDPQNKELSTAGDDRAPAWVWMGYLYHDTKVIGLPADNLMTMLREGGAKVINKGKETYKKQTQAGIVIDSQLWPLEIPKEIGVKQFNNLFKSNDFMEHLTAAESAGFELLVKRAKIGAAKHVRVRPLFRQWSATGTLTVIDAELSGITKPVLQKILDVAGSLCGLGDWRPSSPKSSGTFGRFSATLKKI
jgi:hypothetical protein